MSTQCTEALRERLTSLGENPDEFIKTFDDWKVLGPAGEYASYWFGKDGAYGSLPVSVPSGKLMHVHLVPVLDPDDLERWDKSWSRQGRKVSDRALVYADDLRGNFLLIFILDEPDAHEIASMKKPEHRQLMRQFAVVAEEWAFSGKISA